MVQVEDFTAVGKGLFNISLQMLKFGPVVATRMTVNSLYWLPQGLPAAGAQSVIEAVDHNDAEGMAKMTAEMVKMGLLNLVHDIVVYLCEHDRSDAVAATTAGLLKLGEMDVVTQINNALIASGHTSQATQIAGSLTAQGYSEMTKLAAQSLGGEKGDGVVDTLKKKGQQALETVSGQQQKASDNTHTSTSNHAAPNTSTVSPSDKHDTIEDIISRDSHTKTQQTPGVVTNLVNAGQQAVDTASDSVRKLIDGQGATA